MKGSALAAVAVATWFFACHTGHTFPPVAAEVQGYSLHGCVESYQEEGLPPYRICQYFNVVGQCFVRVDTPVKDEPGWFDCETEEQSDASADDFEI